MNSTCIHNLNQNYSPTGLNDSFSVQMTTDESNLGPMDSPWPMQSRDISHTGQSPYDTSNNNGAELWKYRTYDDGWIEGGIAIDNEGILYFGDHDWFLYALYPNGSLKWKYKTNGAIHTTPALAADGTIYITDTGHYLSAINPEGNLLWKTDLGSAIYSSPVIGDDGTIYTGDHGLYAINPNGTIKWHYPTSMIYSDPAIGKDGTIYIGSINEYLYAINPNGTLKWTYKTDDEIHSNPSIGPDGTIYFGSNDYYFYAVHPNGTLKWKYRINGHLYANAAIGNDGIIYCPDHDLYTFYPDGRVKWIFDFGEEIGVSHSSPAIGSDGTIYIGVVKQGVEGGYIFAVNPDGTEKWRYTLNDYSCRSSPSIGSDGTVYIGSLHNGDGPITYGYLFAFGEGNVAPKKPTITGPETGKTGERYTYSIQTNDLNDDNIYYYIEWGDGTNTGWKGPYESGTELSLSHTWNFQGTYPIRAKAKDETGLESEWSTLEVSMPKTSVFQMLNYLNQYFNLDFFQLFKYC